MSACSVIRKIAGTVALCAAVLFGTSSGAMAQKLDPDRVKQQQATIGQMKGALPATAKTDIKFVDVEGCYSCHADIKEFHAGSKHSDVNCAYCHTGSEEHLRRDGRPLALTQPSIGTRVDHQACGVCHQEQFNTFATINYASKAMVEKADPRGKSPMFDKLMQPHPFTRMHNEPRSHVFMLLDHMLVDRAFGGRFHLRNWRYISDARSAVSDMWNTMLVDREPGSNDQKAFIPQVGTAANPVCMNCKSIDNILSWSYMGDPHPRARWSRVSKPVEFARTNTHPMNCFLCHDPHSSAPRVVRDALIQAAVDRREGTYPYDQKKSAENPMTKVEFRGGFRAIGLLSRPDSVLMCAQCHVEYNGNPGFAPNANPDGTDRPIPLADQRSNLFQWASVFNYNKKMREQFGNFKDFRHGITGAALSKIQHPEVETFWGSVHERAGVECADCHMPKVERYGKTFTDHQQRSPRFMLEQTCLNCHGDMTAEQAVYQMDAIRAHTRGKIVKAEFWLAQLIDTFVRAFDAGVTRDSEAVRQARMHHDEAQTQWEWWTAETSIGFHNPQQARESLTRSVTESQRGIRVLNDAIAARRAAAPVAATR